MNRSHTFSRVSPQIHVFALSFEWFIGLSASFVIGQSNYLVLVLRYSIENRSIRGLDFNIKRYLIGKYNPGSDIVSFLGHFPLNNMDFAHGLITMISTLNV